MEFDAAGWATGMWLLAFIFVAVLTLLWILIPFAIFGIKDLLREQIRLQQRTNAILAELVTGHRDGVWPEPRK